MIRCMSCNVALLESDAPFDPSLLGTKERCRRHRLLCSESCYERWYNPRIKTSSQHACDYPSPTTKNAIPSNHHAAPRSL